MREWIDSQERRSVRQWAWIGSWNSMSKKKLNCRAMRCYLNNRSIDMGESSVEMVGETKTHTNLRVRGRRLYEHPRYLSVCPFKHHPL